MRFSNFLFLAFGLAIVPASASAQTTEKHFPWSNPSLPTAQRVEMVLKKMTLDEKISMLHGTGQPGYGPPSPQGKDSNGGAGYMPAIPRLGIPGIQMADAAYGVTKSGTNGRYSTALPDNMALAATWDTAQAAKYGSLIGRELRAQGYNMTLGGGANLARELRDGRNFEYGGEDPLLAGTMVGYTIKALQNEHVIGDLKHFALNDQESGRNAVNVHIDERSLRETDLLAFQIALQTSGAAAVMCSYNRVNGDFSCENRHLLTDVLRTDWHFPGFVLSDWGGTHSTVKASHAGLDHEEPNEFFFGAPLQQAVENGTVTQEELDDHVRHILYAEFVAGLFDFPEQRSVIDVEGSLRTAQEIAENSMVLLRNQGGILPLSESLRTVAIIGAHADVAMLSGGGSAQVDPPVGNAIVPSGQGATHWMDHIWFPTSPLRELQARAPKTKFIFDAGNDPATAAAVAAKADIALVFAQQWESEAMDLPGLTLPGQQDDLIAEVAKANPHTVVVLETGSATLMPWIDSVQGVVEAWYPGSRGAAALARVLYGDVDPSGRLPLTFPRQETDLPHPKLTIPPPASTEAFYGDKADEQNRKGFPSFDVTYDEGLKVGYKWYEAEHKPVLFPFGFGLSYTTFGYRGLKVTRTADGGVHASLVVTNTGHRRGATIAQLYAGHPESAGEPPRRLVGWSKVELAPGESRDVSITVDPLYLSVYDTGQKRFLEVSGTYTFFSGDSSAHLPLSRTLEVH